MPDDEAPPVLLIMIVRHEASLDELFTGLLDAGLLDVTVVKARDMGTILRHDMPIFAGLGKLLPATGGGRAVFAMAAPAQVDSLRTFVEEMSEADQPTVLIVPVAESFGWKP